MKRVILFSTLFAFTLAACNSKSSNQSNSEHEHAEGHDHSSMPSKSMKNESSAQKSNNTTVILDAYLSIKNALVKDDQGAARKAGAALAASIDNFDISSFKASEQQELKDILEVAKEHREHISNSKIDHQREHFEALSKDIKDLVTIAGADRTLYQQYCPMYDGNKGGMWLSASDEVMNPLFGSKMPKCGSVKETISMK